MELLDRSSLRMSVVLFRKISGIEQGITFWKSFHAKEGKQISFTKHKNPMRSDRYELYSQLSNV